MTNGKKILVIDDSAINQESARATLKDSGYELLISGDYIEGREIMRKERPEVVLLDLLMPASDYIQSDEGSRHVGQQIMAGLPMAMEAVSCGARYVAVATDTNHHKHPASALLDGLRDVQDNDSFTITRTKWNFADDEKTDIGPATVKFMQIGGRFVDKNRPCPDCDAKGCEKCHYNRYLIGDGKDWARVLQTLLKAK